MRVALQPGVRFSPPALAGLLLLTLAVTPIDPLRAEGLQEVFLGDLPQPQEEGSLQAGLAFAWEDGEDGAEASLEMEWGLSEALQIELELEGSVGGDGTELEEIELGLRREVFAVRPGLHAAVGLAVGVVTGGSEEAPEDTVVLSPSWTMGSDVARGRGHVFFSLGIDWVIDEGETVDDGPSEVETLEDTIEAVIGGYLLTSWGGWTLEFSVGRDLEFDQEAEVRAAAGAVITLGDEWELGVGVVIGVDGDAEDALLASLIFEL